MTIFEENGREPNRYKIKNLWTDPEWPIQIESIGKQRERAVSIGRDIISVYLEHCKNAANV